MMSTVAALLASTAGCRLDQAGPLAAEPDPPGGLGQRGQHGPALQVRPGHVPGQRVEVVPVPGRLEQRDRVGRHPDVPDLLPGRVLGPGLDREPHWPSLLGGGFQAAGRPPASWLTLVLRSPPGIAGPRVVTVRPGASWNRARTPAQP